MSNYVGYVVKVKDIRPHSNADKLQVATFFGNDTCVDLSVNWGDVGVYFPEDLQLSKEFCEANNLCRKKDAEGNNIGGYMDPDKRNIKTIKLRGEKSDGLYLPITCFSYIDNIETVLFSEGDKIDNILGHEICTKYVPKRKTSSNRKEGNRTRKKRVDIAPLFAEHADTEQLVYNVNDFRDGDLIEITLKVHGTSQRTGYLPVLKGYKRSLVDRIFGREGKPVYDWGYVTGTRRVVLDNYDGGFYGDNSFREQHAKKFEGKLLKGESVYYEVAGFTDNGTPIMGVANNKKVNDSKFRKIYGDTTTFSYGCAADGVGSPQSKIFVYRMTMTNEDGDVVEYTPDYMRYRCEQMGVETVPVFYKGYIDAALRPVEDIVIDLAERCYDGPDPIGKTHIREGVVVRIVNKPKFTAYKHKNVEFKILSGIIKDSIDLDNNIDEDMLNEM